MVISTSTDLFYLNLCTSFCFPPNCIVFEAFLFPISFREQYPEIWALDEKDPFMRPEGGESVNDVVSRLATAMAAMELEFQG